MFGSSVPAFYALARRRYYLPFPCIRFGTCLLSRNGRVETKTIVHWMSQILFATEIAFGGLHRRVPQQEPNLFQLYGAAAFCEQHRVCLRLPRPNQMIRST